MTLILGRGVLGALLLLLVAGSGARLIAQTRDDLAAWRAAYETTLRAEDGWLSVAGLFFLEPGENTVGVDAANAIQLPAGTAPPRAGTFVLHDGQVSFTLDDGVAATLEGKPVRTGILRPATSSRPADLLRLGRLTLLVHRSGNRFAIRLRDPENPIRRDFTGVRWFPPDPSWRVTATYVRFDEPRSMSIVNVLGDPVTLPSPGYVEFEREGHAFRLEPALESDGRLWFIFTDTTAGAETYGAARFLYLPPTTEGQIVLDFNRAENPPCVYNPYTTCPLPPRANRLPIAVRAGERAYPDGPHP